MRLTKSAAAAVGVACWVVVGPGCQSKLRTLESYMAGSFNSGEQHRADPEQYFDIRLHMVPIWEDRADGPWLYVEQAAAQALEKPYRQRVYRLRANRDGTLESMVYELPGDPLRFAGAWRDPAAFDGLSPEDVVLREGCSILLRRAANGDFVGSTSGKDCRSTLRGASYATSEVVITRDELLSWDRGFDEEGRQVWGATEGGYRFVKDDASSGGD